MLKNDSKFLPEYDNPPITEVVCGVLFKPVVNLLVPHIGLLWEKFKAEYPLCKEVAPLTPMIEQFETAQGLGFEITEIPPLPRIWFLQTNDNGIIQIQRDRLLYNWRKIRMDDEYPRYHKVL